MLKSIINLEKESRLFVIEDSCDVNADQLFASIVFCHKNLSGHTSEMICTEQSPASYENGPLGNTIVYHDMFSDPCNWISQSEPCSLLENILNSPTDRSRTFLFIDSVSPLTWIIGIRKFCDVLRRLLNIYKRVVCRVHEDTLLHKSDSNKIAHYASTHVKIVSRTLTQSHRFVAIVSHVKPDGKCERRQTEEISVEDNLSLSTSLHVETLRDVPQRTVNMSSLTTFNLGVELSSSEKKARDELILPYLRTSNEEGVVHYEADDADLEEDPDDDLEL